MTKKTGNKLRKMFGIGPKVTIDGKEYLQSDLSTACMNALAAFQAAQNRAAIAQQDLLLAHAAMASLRGEISSLLPPNGVAPGETPPSAPAAQ